MKTFCPYCGIANAQSVSTCHACGTDLAAAPAPSQPPTAPNFQAPEPAASPYPYHPTPPYPAPSGPPPLPPAGIPAAWPQAQAAATPPDYWYPPSNTGYRQPQGSGATPPVTYGQLNGRYPALYTPVTPAQSQHPAYYPQPQAAAIPYERHYDPFAAQQAYGYSGLMQPVQSDLADVGARLGAMVLDCIALTVPLFMLLIFAAATESATVGSMAALLSVFGPALYFIACWASGGQTLGYRALGLRLVRTDGSQPGVGSAIARFIGVSLCALMFIPGMIGILWMLWDYRRQGWHDKMGDTLVVKA